MLIEPINENSSRLIEVKALWRANSATLGFFTDGAFCDYAKRGQILGAVTSDGDLAGYLIYRLSRDSAKIVHLCSAEQCRGQNIGRALICRLKELTQGKSYGISLKCRTDYRENNVWHRFGFTCITEVPGRSREGKKLAVWWYDHGQPNLFSGVAQHHDFDKVSAVIDANVFFDLYGDYDPEGEESQGLISDYLTGEVDYFVTPELLTEIARRKNEFEKIKYRAIVNGLRTASAESVIVDDLENRMRPLFKSIHRAQTLSDIRQLAHTIACGISYFITRDRGILSLADSLYDLFGITIDRPMNFVLKLDELIREVDYQPAKLVGSRVEICSIGVSEEKNLLKFWESTSGEEKTAFDQRTRRILSQPSKYISKLVTESKHRPIAIVSYGTDNGEVIEIPLFRLMKNTLAPTIARRLILEIISTVITQKCIVKIVDPYLGVTAHAAAQELGFFQVNDELIKVCLPITACLNQLLSSGISLINEIDEFDIYARTLKQKDAIEIMKLEQIFWPGKVTDFEMPCFIIPIKPYWAQHLFDEGMASQSLFPVENVALNVESVYYRSAQAGRGIAAPARVLWYVSGDKEYHGVKAIRACSYLQEIFTGKPKEIFRRFRRLGIYQWEEINRMIHGNLDKDIMALRFTLTEVFANPISLPDLKNAFALRGKKFSIQSPLPISNKTFLEIYQKAK